MTDTSGSTSMTPRMSESGMMPRMGTMVSSARVFYTQPGVQRALPTIAAAVLVIVGLIFYILLQTPDRTTLFASLPETEKAKVLETLRNNGTDVQVDATTGEITISLTAAQTNALVAGRYVYDAEITSAGGTVTRVIEGQIEVTPGVTQ